MSLKSSFFVDDIIIKHIYIYRVYYKSNIDKNICRQKNSVWYNTWKN